MVIGCALSDRDIDHNSKVLNAFYLFIEYIHFVCLKHIAGRDMCACMCFSVVTVTVVVTFFYLSLFELSCHLKANLF